MNYKSTILLPIVALVLTICSCSPRTEQANIITVTIEPQRYFLEQLVDTFFQVKTMVPPGSSPETFDPSPRQMSELSRSRAYFAIGKIGFENVWLDKLQKNNPRVAFYDNSTGIDWIISEHEHSHGEHCRHEHGIDPHTWASPREASIIVENMYRALVDLDPEHQAVYDMNYARLQKEINETDEAIRSLLDNSSAQAFIIYHPTLSYFARYYDLEQYALESDGKEPSPEQLRRLIDTAREKNIRTVFVQEEFDRKNATLIAKEINARLVTINPLSYNWHDEMLHIAKSLSDE